MNIFKSIVFKKWFSPEHRSVSLTIVLSFILVAFLIFLANQMPIDTNYRPGDSAHATIVSDDTFSYFDKNDERELKSFYESSEPFYYTFDSEHQNDFDRRFKDLLNIFKIPNDNDFKKAMIAKNFVFSIPVWNYIQKNRFLLIKYQNRVRYLYRKITESFVIVDKIPDMDFSKFIYLYSDNNRTRIPVKRITTSPPEKNLVMGYVEKSYPRFSQLFKDSLAEILVNLITPTARLNNTMRNKNIQQNILNRRRQKLIQRGDILIKQGENISDENLSKLRAYKEHRDSLAGHKLLTFIILSLLLYTGILYRLGFFELRAFLLSRNIYMTALFFVSTIILFYFSNLIKLDVNIPAFLIIPFGIISLSLPELLRNTRVAIILLFSFSLFFFFFPNFDMISFMAFMVISLSTIYTSRLLTNRTRFFTVGIIIGLINLVFLFLYLQYSPSANLARPWLLITFALGNGLTSAIISLGMMPLLENVFNVPTTFRLLELGNPTISPLLQKLKVEAPGTYNHSMLIGDMCAEAATAIGLDSLIIRVGGYYHDIGKMENPNYFIENQEGKNKHDDIKPNISVSVIKSHVKLGVELAHQYKLPEELIDYIREHHGTTAISYFYHMALGLRGDENVNMEDYQYPGPRPHSKDTALLMLADTIEATVRAYSQNQEKFSSKIIQEIIDDTVEKRMAEGQLSDCDITLAEITSAKVAFFKYLSGYYHKRIEYPKK